MTATAMHGVRLNVANLDRAQQFYTGLGMVEDIGMRRADRPDGPTSVLAANDPARTSTLGLSPCDGPAILTCTVNLVACDPSSPQQGWPKSVDQLGSTVLTLLVADLDAEVRRLVDDREQRLCRCGCYGTVEWPDAIRLRRGSGWKRRRVARMLPGPGLGPRGLHGGRGTDDLPAPPTQYLRLRSDVRVLCRLRIRPGSAERRKAERRLPTAHRHEPAQSVCRSLRSATEQQGHQRRQPVSIGRGPFARCISRSWAGTTGIWWFRGQIRPFTSSASCGTASRPSGT